MGRLLLAAVVMSAAAQPQARTPKWFSDSANFCSELARRTNGANGPALKDTKSIALEQYSVDPITRPRTDQAIIGKDEAFEPRRLAEAEKLEAKQGPDFAGQYVVVQWTCGTWCANSVIVDVRTGKESGLPFVGVVGCTRATGEHSTIERRANSRLMIVRGRPELPMASISMMVFAEHFIMFGRKTARSSLGAS